MPEHRRLALALLALYLLFSWPGPPLDPMANRAIAQAEAFSHGRLRIRGPERYLSGDFLYPDGPDGGGVGIAEFGGPALFAPISFVTRQVGDGEPFRPTRVFTLSVLYIILLSALPAAAGMACLLLLLRRLNIPRAFLAATLCGTSLLLPQAATITPHGLSTGLACLSLLLLVQDERSPRDGFLAGLGAGLAVLSYFGALLPLAIPIGIYGVATGSRRARLALVAGAAGPALLLAAWNTVSYGAPWALPSLDQAVGAGGIADIKDRNVFFTLSLPDARRLWEVTVGTRRGILVFAPVLALGLAGLKPLWRRRRDLALLFGAIALLAVLQAAAKPISWHGGTAAGPRYLLPFVLALSVPLGFGLAHYRRLGLWLGGASAFFAACTAQTALYGSLLSCVQDVLSMAPRLRLVLTLSHLAESGFDHMALATWVSLLVAPPLLFVIIRWLTPCWPGARTAAPVVAGAWILLSLPWLLFGPRGHSPLTLRLAEVRRFVRTEPEPLRLEWYAAELLGLGDPAAAAETVTRSIELGGWKDSRVRTLRKALETLSREGRSEEVKHFLARVAPHKPREN